jgi:hypothetical protein
MEPTSDRYKSLILVVLLLMVSTMFVFGNNKDEEPISSYQRIDISYAIGGQIYNDNFIYNPGGSFQTTFGFHVNKDVAIGIGAGYQAFEDEKFIPIYAEVLGYKKQKNNAPFIKMQMGYSLGWSDAFPDNINYDYSGGVFIDVGMGRKINLKNNYSIMFHWSYRHQFATMEYETYGNETYTQNLNYDMIVISLGIMKTNR